MLTIDFKFAVIVCVHASLSIIGPAILMLVPELNDSVNAELIKIVAAVSCVCFSQMFCNDTPLLVIIIHACVLPVFIIYKISRAPFLLTKTILRQAISPFVSSWATQISHFAPFQIFRRHKIGNPKEVVLASSTLSDVIVHSLGAPKDSLRPNHRLAIEWLETSTDAHGPITTASIYNKSGPLRSSRPVSAPSKSISSECVMNIRPVSAPGLPENPKAALFQPNCHKALKGSSDSDQSSDISNYDTNSNSEPPESPWTLPCKLLSPLNDASPGSSSESRCAPSNLGLSTTSNIFPSKHLSSSMSSNQLSNSTTQTRSTPLILGLPVESNALPELLSSLKCSETVKPLVIRKANVTVAPLCIRKTPPLVVPNRTQTVEPSSVRRKRGPIIVYNTAFEDHPDDDVPVCADPNSSQETLKPDTSADDTLKLFADANIDTDVDCNADSTQELMHPTAKNNYTMEPPTSVLMDKYSHLLESMPYDPIPGANDIPLGLDLKCDAQKQPLQESQTHNMSATESMLCDIVHYTESLTGKQGPNVATYLKKSNDIISEDPMRYILYYCYSRVFNCIDLLDIQYREGSVVENDHLSAQTSMRDQIVDRFHKILHWGRCGSSGKHEVSLLHQMQRAYTACMHNTHPSYDKLQDELQSSIKGFFPINGIQLPVHYCVEYLKDHTTKMSNNYQQKPTSPAHITGTYFPLMGMYEKYSERCSRKEIDEKNFCDFVWWANTQNLESQHDYCMDMLKGIDFWTPQDFEQDLCRVRNLFHNTLAICANTDI